VPTTNDRRRAARSIAALAVALSALLATACGFDESPQALIASAKQYLTKKDYAGATIQLRNALQRDPDNAEARYLLGVSLLERRDPVPAERELRRALALNYPAERVYVPLARAYLETGRADAVVKEFGDKAVADPEAQAALQTSVGRAQLALGKPEEARAAFARALAAKPDDVRAKLGETRLLASEGNLADATRIVDDILAASPTDSEALFLKGEILIAQGKDDSARAAFERSVDANPDDFAARQALVSLLIAKREFGPAAAQLELAKKATPGDLRIDYLEALVALRKGDSAAARNAILQVLSVAPDHAPSLVLAGAAEFQAGAWVQAVDYLHKALARAPHQVLARRLLVASYLRQGQADRAMDALQPLLADAALDPITLQLASEVYLANNDLKAATQYLEKASESDPRNVAAQTRLAEFRFAAGDVDRAVKDLEALSDADPEQVQADLALILAHLRRHELDQALGAAQRLEKKQPKNPLGYNLAGAVDLARGELGPARGSFEKALELAPTSPPALRNLALLDLQQGQPGQARKRYEDALAKEPTNAQLLLAFAEFLRASGADQKERSAVIERAVTSDPKSVAARVAKVNLLMRTGDAKQALIEAQQANVAIPGDPRLLEMLGVVEQANGDVNQAITTFQQEIAVSSPRSAGPLVRLAGAYAAAKDYTRAVQTLRKALALQPDRAEIRRDIALLEVQAGRPEVGLAEARAIQTQKPKDPVGFVIEGELFVAQKKWPEAAHAYRQAFALGRTPALLVRLHAALSNAGNSKEADEVARAWLKVNPNDVAVRSYLAERDLSEKDYKSAAQLYRVILEHAPNNAAVLNNLAWATSQLNDPQAVGYAEQANRLAPNNPAIMDTLGWLLVGKGDTARGLELLQRASGLAPDSQEMRLHLAKALASTGRKDAARKELETLLKAPDPSPSKDEASTLMRSL